MKHKYFVISLLAAIIMLTIDANGAETHSNDLFSIKVKEKCGYIDKTGKLSILPQFDEAKPFFEGLTQVKRVNKWGYISKTGQILIKPQFDWTEPFSNGLALVRIGTRPKYIDKQGKIVRQFDE
jgi:hypothetical protein